MNILEIAPTPTQRKVLKDIYPIIHKILQLPSKSIMVMTTSNGIKLISKYGKLYDKTTDAYRELFNDLQELHPIDAVRLRPNDIIKELVKNAYDAIEQGKQDKELQAEYITDH